jgi:hypothetical protein
MTLQDKFYNIGYNEYGFDYDECEKIADNYAIGFAEWLMDGHVSELTLKEYKKEKGL